MGHVCTIRLNELTQTVLYYVTACVDSVIVSQGFSNQKPWKNKTTQTLLKTRDFAYRSWDR